MPTMHYQCQTWPERTEFRVRYKNTKWVPIFDPKYVLMAHQRKVHEAIFKDFR